MSFRMIREGDAPPPAGDPEKRPQDPHLDGRDLKFQTLEHGGAEPDTMPNSIRVTDPQGRKAIYVFKEIEMETTTEVLTESEPRLADAEQVKHTPGPWTVVLRGERGTFHIPQAQKHEAANTEDGVDGYTVSSANARLIAAAPDMFAALRAVVAGSWDQGREPSYSVEEDAIKKARVALAKAEGRAPTPPSD